MFLEAIVFCARYHFLLMLNLVDPRPLGLYQPQEEGADKAAEEVAGPD